MKITVSSYEVELGEWMYDVSCHLRQWTVRRWKKVDAKIPPLMQIRAVDGWTGLLHAELSNIANYASSEDVFNMIQVDNYE